MRNDIRAALAAGMCMLVLGAGFLFLRTMHADAQSFRDQIAACKQSEDRSSADDDCYRGVVLGALQERDGADLMEELALLEGRVCHFAGHVLGRELFKKYQSAETALMHCTQGCSAACLHGIVNQALVVPGTSTDVNGLEHTDDATLRESGEKLCAMGTHACHGVGHVLFQLHLSLGEALPRCAEFAPEGEERWVSCVRGIFMDSTAGEYRLPRTEAERTDLLFPCRQAEERYRTPCFHLTHHEQARVFKTMGITDASSAREIRFAACESLERRVDYLACIEGATYIEGLAAPCKQYEDDEDAFAICVFGVARGQSAFDRYDIVIQYCANQELDVTKGACYDAYFSSLRTRKVRPLEGACADSPDNMCIRHLERYGKDPKNTVFSRLIGGE